MQNDFITGTLGSDMAVDIVENVKGVISEAQKNNSTIIFTRDTHAKNYLEKDGKLFLVIRKEQGAKSLIVDLKKIYNVEIVAKKKGFFILKCYL